MGSSGTDAEAARPLIVLGMHRSGTSLLTGLLALAGVWVGTEEELTAPNEENPKGFFERRDLRAICDALLRAGGAEWWRPADFDPAAVPEEARSAQLEAWRQLVRSFDARGVWAVKEPRLCLVFPLLRPALDTPVCLHVLRDPLEVARSLQARNGFGIIEGLALWELYTRRALAASAGLPRIPVLYTDLVARPAAALAALSDRLQAVGAAALAVPDAAALAGFVAPELHRQKARSEETAILLSPGQAALWADLVAGREPEPLALGPAARQALADLAPRRTEADRLRAESARNAALAERLTAAHRLLKGELRAARSSAEELSAALEVRNERVASLERSLERQCGETAAAQREGAAERQRAKALDTTHAAALEARNERIANLQQALERQRGETAAAQRDGSALAAARRHAEAELAQIRHVHDRVIASSSWRITAPLRAAGDALRRRPGLTQTPAEAPAKASGRPFLDGIGERVRVDRRLRRARDERLVRGSALFDGAWYLAEYPDVAALGLDPPRHFLDKGRSEGLNPSAAFDAADYLARYPDVARSGENPLVHYLRRGGREGREIYPVPEEMVRCSALFDGAWYLAEYPDVAALGLDPLRHFLDKGRSEGRNPSAAFAAADYLARYPDVARSGQNPLVHYLRQGRREEREVRSVAEALVRHSALFDRAWYLEEYPDVAAAGHDPVHHFLDKGSGEGRNPSAAFDAADYIARYPDVARSGENPLVHYLRRGEREGRRFRSVAEGLVAGSPLFDQAWYLERYVDVAAAGVDPMQHFLSRGWREGRSPSAAFDAADYMLRYPEVARSGENPLVHYLRRGEREGREIRPPAAGAEPPAFDPGAAEAWAAALRETVAAEGETPPLVSVVMPTRDRLALLPAAIESVLAQSYGHWELLVVDDGSTDGTADSLRERFTDPRIRLLSTPGVGVSGARNAGLVEARGALVAYLDSDNSWTPEYLELMVAEFARSQAASVYAVLKVREKPGSPAWYRAQPFDRERLKHSNYIDLNIFMHRRELYHRLGGFDVSLRRVVDWDLILRYVRDDPVSFAHFVGAEYDNSDRPDRLTVSELFAFKNVVRNRHWVDWEAEEKRSRDPELVSVVMCLQGLIENVEERLGALFVHPAGCRFELVLVENGCDAVSRALVKDWSRREPAVRLIEPGENVGRALGSNLGLAAAAGATLVFLDQSVEVAPEWLRALVRPLRDHAVDHAVMGAQPKILAPDGSICATGLAFGAGPFPLPVDAGRPGDWEPSMRPGARAAISGYCAAFRAADLVGIRGFHPIYTRGLDDADLCLRLAGGAARFAYVPDAVVRLRPDAPRSSSGQTEDDRGEFEATWTGRTPVDDIGGEADEGGGGDARVALWRPAVPARARAGQGLDPGVLAGRCIALKIGCPRPEMKDHWGDYHFAAALAAAFLRKGVSARIDFAAEPDRHAHPSDINLVLRGRQLFPPKPGTLNLLWLISHPDRPGLDELRGFDQVFVASEVWTRRLAGTGLACQTLLQCTDSARFSPMPPEPALRSPALFVANSRKVLRSVVREAIEQNLKIDIYGEMWEGLAPADWVRAEKIDNVDLPKYYASADVVLNDHWDSMREGGFVSNRIFDVLACATPLVTDRVAGLPEEIAGCCHVFGEGVTLTEAVAAARRAGETGRERALEVADLVRRDHSFDARAGAILAVAIAKLRSGQDARSLAG